MTEAAVTLVPYSAERQTEWNEFVGRAKNGVFLFDRRYMEYHADRFQDYSLMVYHRGALAAVLPANRDGETLVTHGGLTFGGFVSDKRMKQTLMIAMFGTLAEHLAADGIARIIYKPIPHIYHSLPAEEDLYALFRAGAVLIGRSVSSAIRMDARIGLSKGRKWSTNRGKRAGIPVGRSHDFARFMAIEEEHLRTKFGVAPTHAADEIAMLAERMPDAIKLFTAERGGELLGGVIVYESANVAHAQYIAATAEGKEVGALDVILEYLLDECYSGKRYFDFGISTDHAGRELNVGLVENKESFGARAVMYDAYEIRLG